MNEEKKYPPLEEEEGAMTACEPAAGALAYEQMPVVDDPIFDFDGLDLGLPRTMDEVESELREAERELKDSSKWTSLNSFISDFKQEHATWLK